jgi:hypothetical protein
MILATVSNTGLAELWDTLEEFCMTLLVGKDTGTTVRSGFERAFIKMAFISTYCGASFRLPRDVASEAERGGIVAGAAGYRLARISSMRIGRWRKRVPVAWKTALPTAAATPTMAISPSPLTPSGLISGSGSSTKSTSI